MVTTFKFFAPSDCKATGQTKRAELISTRASAGVDPSERIMRGAPTLEGPGRVHVHREPPIETTFQYFAY